MPITSSAKKALRSSKRKHIVNLQRKDELKESIKNFKKSIDLGDEKNTKKALNALYRKADKIAKTGYIKTNKASRIKSRATKMLNKHLKKKQRLKSNK